MNFGRTISPYEVSHSCLGNEQLRSQKKQLRST